MTTIRTLRLYTVLPLLAGLLIGGNILATGAAAAPARGSIKSVTLTTADVSKTYGGGLRSFINGVISNKDLATEEKASGASSVLGVTGTGRVTGFVSVWFRGSRTAYVSVTNAVSEYRSSSFPQAMFGHFNKPIKSIKGISMRFSPFSGIGDQAFKLTTTSHGTTALGIIFRRGRYLVELQAAVLHGATSLSSISRLAALEDQRIQANG